MEIRHDQYGCPPKLSSIAPDLNPVASIFAGFHVGNAYDLGRNANDFACIRIKGVQGEPPGDSRLVKGKKLDVVIENRPEPFSIDRLSWRKRRKSDQDNGARFQERCTKARERTHGIASGINLDELRAWQRPFAQQVIASNGFDILYPERTTGQGTGLSGSEEIAWALHFKFKDAGPFVQSDLEKPHMIQGIRFDLLLQAPERSTHRLERDDGVSEPCHREREVPHIGADIHANEGAILALVVVSNVSDERDFGRCKILKIEHAPVDTIVGMPSVGKPVEVNRELPSN